MTLSMPSELFALHPQLAADSVWIADLPLCQLRLMNDARFTWLLLIPRVADAHEWFELEPAGQLQLHHENMLTATTLKRLLACDKINLACLGNVVAQLHVHVIARRHDDALWPHPVWGSPVTNYAPNELESLLEKLRAAFAAH